MSSLSAAVENHAPRSGGRAVPRREVDPPPVTIVPYQGPRRLPKELRRPQAVGTLSPGDSFETSLTGKLGRVLAHSVIDVSEPDVVIEKGRPTFKHPLGKPIEREVPQPREMRRVTLVEIRGERKLLAFNTMVIPL